MTFNGQCVSQLVARCNLMRDLWSCFRKRLQSAVLTLMISKQV